jgi:hypothetical protein
MAFTCPYTPRDASTCANCPLFDECLEENTGDEKMDEDDYDPDAFGNND